MILLAQSFRMLSAYALAQVLTGVQLGSVMAFLVLVFDTSLVRSAAILPVGLVLVAVQARVLHRWLGHLPWSRPTS